MAFSPSSAAVEGFRVLRREPKAALVWAVVLIALHFGAALLLFPLLRSIMPGMMYGSPLDRVIDAFSFLGAELLVMVVLASLMACAIYRAILRPEERGLGRLKLGADEVRMLVVVLLQTLLFAAWFLVALVSAAMVAALAQSVETGSPGGAPSMPIMTAVFLVALVVVTGWIGVRLSLAGPMTFVEGRHRLFASWRLTRRAFWPLLGCYAMALVCTALIWLIGYGVSSLAATTVAGRPLKEAYFYLSRSDARSLQSYFPLAKVVGMALAAGFSAATWTLMLAPAAAAYRAIVGLGPERQAEVFD